MKTDIDAKMCQVHSGWVRPIVTAAIDWTHIIVVSD